MPSSLRKSLSFREASALHAVCGGFLHYLAQLQKAIPESEFLKCRSALETQFLSGCIDPEIEALLEGGVPPGDPKAIGCFRPSGHALYTQATCCSDCAVRSAVHLLLLVLARFLFVSSLLCQCPLFLYQTLSFAFSLHRFFSPISSSMTFGLQQRLILISQPSLCISCFESLNLGISRT